jgi:hypothetical protein
MRKLLSWPNGDDEFNEFAVSRLNDIDTLLFGRATCEGMAGHWPTPARTWRRSAVPT